MVYTSTFPFKRKKCPKFSLLMLASNIELVLSAGDGVCQIISLATLHCFSETLVNLFGEGRHLIHVSDAYMRL